MIFLGGGGRTWGAWLGICLTQSSRAAEQRRNLEAWLRGISRADTHVRHFGRGVAEIFWAWFMGAWFWDFRTEHFNFKFRRGRLRLVV